MKRPHLQHPNDLPQTLTSNTITAGQDVEFQNVTFCGGGGVDVQCPTVGQLF